MQSMVVVSVKVLSMGQIDLLIPFMGQIYLFKNYLYSSRKCAEKKMLLKKTKKQKM